MKTRALLLTAIAGLLLLPAVSEAKRISKFGMPKAGRFQRPLKRPPLLHHNMAKRDRARMMGRLRSPRTRVRARLLVRNVNNGLRHTTRMLSRARPNTALYSTLVKAQAQFAAAKTYARYGQHRMAVNAYLGGCVLRMQAGRLNTMAAPIQ